MRLGATYRVQFREGMTFAKAAAEVPYLKRLGITHLYASPIFAAAAGSTHGYDVTDHNRLDPALGGEDGFTRLSEALKRDGLGLILDIVPNHMAASTENPWFESVLEWGEASPYARHFDIDWTAGHVTLPFLGASFQDCLAKGELSLDAEEDGRIVLKYYDNRWPLAPRSYALVAERLGPDVHAVGERAAHADAAGADAFHESMRRLFAETGFPERLKAVATDADIIRAVHEAQAWRLYEWRSGRRFLTYRRFFEITGLIGVRVEDEPVFEDAHRLVLDLVRTGRVDGLRIDHVDGLADPAGYLKRLRAAVGPDVPVYVEKILEPGEPIRADWPIEGTTGYEFIAALADAFTDAAKARTLDAAYADALGAASDYQAELQKAKTEIVTSNLEGELTLLTGQAMALARALSPKDTDEEDLREALIDLMVAFPVYRTYVNADGVTAADAALLDGIETRFDVSGTIDKSPKGLDFLFRLLRLQVPDDRRDEVLAFVTRFQQTTGPVMAKALEDTLFFRFNRLIALNEVGGDPEAEGGGAEAFHAAMRERAATEPHGLSATATHDTKRGEDARARLYTIGEAPEIWGNAVARWREMHAGLVTTLPGGPAPGPDTEWMLYQALLGAWPMADRAPDWLGPFRDRFLAFVEKAMREDKRRTGWTEVDEAYEAAVNAYAARLLDPANRAFLADFRRTAAPFIAAGAINSLSQTLLKLTAPGVPDIYNGAEAWDFSLVDPDNRRAVDFDALAQGLDSAPSWPPTQDQWTSGAVKQHLVAAALKARAEHPALFAEGTYEPLAVAGPAAAHVIAFARRHGGEAAIVIAPRLVLRLIEGDRPAIAAARWSGTTVSLGGLAARRLTDALSGRDVAPAEALDLEDVLAAAPLALLLFA
ncbi:MAG: malto-oligosyltrehalose synthase [Pararhizobium sp.]